MRETFVTLLIGGNQGILATPRMRKRK